jgi:tetraprenyl-beta-curcumene synthase
MRSSIFPWLMAIKIILKVQPDVHRYLGEWKQMAETIPDAELRKQALLSIETKTFHCEGGAIYALLAGNHYLEVLPFIIAFQTISDYLDNLCDRSTSLDPDDFRALHESMLHALTPGIASVNYYRFRNEQNDGGYLSGLVQTCQDMLDKLPSYTNIAPFLHELVGYYCDLQVHKHERTAERLPLLKAWFEVNRERLPEMKWNEFAACTGSTLGIFCLVAYASSNNCSIDWARRVKNGYFPWVQGLHIMLDYLIDQGEDRMGGDLNFCSFYQDNNEMLNRFKYLYTQAEISVASLPNAHFHSMVNRGLVGMYLADRKVSQQKEVRKVATKVLQYGGTLSIVAFIYYRVHRVVSRSGKRNRHILSYK